MKLSPPEIERAVEMFAAQRRYCASAGAQTYVAILDGCIEDTRSGGPICDILTQWDGNAEGYLSLRILGALHRLVLDGKAPQLAAVFPSAGGTHSPEKAWLAARPAIATHREFILGYCKRPPQTNEVGRSAVLLGGFLEVAKRIGKPLRLLEIGASAGLNLMWDKFKIETEKFTWGDSTAELVLRPKWEGPAPSFDTPITIASRAACDRDPIDIKNRDDSARLESYVWTDQVHRVERLRAACKIARQTPFRLDQADAADWLELELQDLPMGQATVVFHSIFRQYLSPASETHFQAVMEMAGTRATADAPLAWLAMEAPDLRSFPNLTLTIWPRGTPEFLASAHHHGEWVNWRS